MRIASTVTVLVLIAAGCGSKSPGTGGDDGSGGSDGGTTGSNDGGDHGGQTPTNVTLTMHHQPHNAAQFSYLVAYQDGSSPWTLAPAPSGEVYTLPIYAPVYAVAWTCIAAGAQPNSTLRQVSELQFAVAERTALTVEVPPRCSDAFTTANLHGTVSNTGIATTYTVKWGDRSAVTNQQGQYAMQVVPGTHDLVVLAGSSFSTSGEIVASDAIVQRDVTVNAATQVDIDGNNEESIQSFAVNNMFSGNATTTLYAKGTTAVMVNDSSFSFENESLAADQMAASDVYDQQLTMTGIGTSASESSATATPADETWVDVPALGTVTGTATMAPNPRITSTWTHYANAVGYTWGAVQVPGNGGQGNGCGANGGTCTITWSAQLSAGVIGDQGTYTMPDLSALTGWNPALQMVAGTRIGGGVQAMTSSATGDFPALVPPTVGTQRTFATSQFSVMP
jgi:hypothetical protein